MASETIGQANAATPGGAKPQPVAMEIPVTVNGARTVAGSEKREPFSEATQTVLVFGSGAVIRLTAAVGPGQLLFVTNEESKQEVVCQVVKTKQNGNTAGYVELKFTEATTDFWGIRAPWNGTGSPVSAVPSLGAIGAPTKSLEQKMTDQKSATPAATQPSSVQIPAPPVAFVAPSAPLAAQPAAQANEIQAAPAVPAQPPTSRVPTLSEFLTHGSNGPELKARDKQQVAKIEYRETATAVLTEEKPVSARPAASPVSNEHDNKPSLSVALGVSQSPAPGSASFDLSADLPSEEVKIPAWLEPLARNAAAVESKPGEAKTSEARVADASSVEQHVEERVPTSGLSAPVDEHEATPVFGGEGRAPNFGTSLALGSQADTSTSSGKGLKIALAIAALLIAAAAAWYWFVNQAPKVSAGGIGTVAESNPASIPAPGATASVSEPASSSAANSGNFSAAPASQPTTTALPTALPTVRPNGSSPSGNVSNASTVTKNAASAKNLADTTEEVVAEESAKKPTLGKVRLSAPKVTRSATGSENGTPDPGLAINGVSDADSSGISMLANKGKGPVAPLPIGGDVKVAKLISSVPPVYPQLARTQRVSGDVTIDALIDVNGRVTTTRVLSGPALLHDAATNAVKQWKYQPATLNGTPAATHLTVMVQFKLQ